GDEFQRADALDRDLAALALRLGQRDHTRFDLERSAFVLALEADEELMTARRRVGDGDDNRAVAMIARFERAAGDAGQLVTSWQPHVERARRALHDRDVDE